MNKYLSILFILLFLSPAIAQKKKKIDTPPKVEQVEVYEGDQNNSNNENSYPYPIVKAAGSLFEVRVTTIKGKEIKVSDLAAFEKLDFSEFKTLHLYRRNSDDFLEFALLEKIVDDATALETLIIENFKIDVFPEVKKVNTKLKKLWLDYNDLKTLPSSISNLVALEDFSCTNPLQEIPDSLSQLTNLTKLTFNNSDLSVFPEAIFELPKLSILYISGVYNGKNKIKVIPDLFAKLPELKKFGVTRASLSELPKSISQLKKLNEVDFSRNQFTEFPAALAENKNLVYVAFSNNPLNYNEFKTSIHKIKWRGLFFLNETGFSKKQYEEFQQILPKIDVYYDQMND